jgi:hypothetical protein
VSAGVQDVWLRRKVEGFSCRFVRRVHGSPPAWLCCQLGCQSTLPGRKCSGSSFSGNARSRVTAFGRDAYRIRTGRAGGPERFVARTLTFRCGTASARDSAAWKRMRPRPGSGSTDRARAERASTCAGAPRTACSTSCSASISRAFSSRPGRGMARACPPSFRENLCRRGLVLRLDRPASRRRIRVYLKASHRVEPR